MGVGTRAGQAVWRKVPDSPAQGELEPGARRGSARTGPEWRRAVLRGAAWTAVAILVFLAAWREARQESVQSDGANAALQAWQMLHGNLLLRGWRLVDVSYYTTELPVYILVEAVRGLRGDVVAISESINYTLTLVCGALVAKGRATGREGTVRALLAAGIMFAPTLAAANWLLNDADHAATALWVLFALLVIDRAGRHWYVPVVVTVILAWAVVGDPLVEVIGCAPLLIAGVVRARPDKMFRGTALDPAWLRERWFELSLAAAGIMSALLGREATRMIASAGGWMLTAKDFQFVHSGSLPSNVAVEVQDFFVLFSANFFNHKIGLELVPIVIHLAGAAVVAVGIWAGVRRFARGRREGDDLIADVLVLAIACNLGAYLLLYAGNVYQVRDVAPVFAFGAALAGRVLGASLARNRLEPLLALGLVCYLFTMGPALTGRAKPPENLSLTGWLEQHHLSSGLSGYWQANSVTFDSGGRIVMLPVRGGKDGRPMARMFETDMNQWDAAANSADFLVLTSGSRAARPAITEDGAIRKFGKPVATYRYQGYTIMVWDENLLRFL